jgi:hypothetical protein
MVYLLIAVLHIDATVMLACDFGILHSENKSSGNITDIASPGMHQTSEKYKNTGFLYRFTFESVPDLPGVLVIGRERMYFKYCYDR